MKLSVDTIFLHILSSKTTVCLLLLRSFIPPELLHAPYSAYIFWNNWRILVFKVSKQPYRSAWHDEIIFRWRHNPPGGENLN